MAVAIGQPPSGAATVDGRRRTLAAAASPAESTATNTAVSSG
jgi:hypothetical protein